MYRLNCIKTFSWPVNLKTVFDQPCAAKLSLDLSPTSHPWCPPGEELCEKYLPNSEEAVGVSVQQIYSGYRGNLPVASLCGQLNAGFYFVSSQGKSQEGIVGDAKSGSWYRGCVMNHNWFSWVRHISSEAAREELSTENAITIAMYAKKIPLATSI